MQHLVFSFLSVLIISVGVASQGISQTRTFKIGALVGFNASQLDGDLHSGYHKVGFVGGVRGVAVLNEDLDLSFELLFSQRGSRSKSRGRITQVTNPSRKRLEINLDYAEAPVLINFKTHDGWWDYKAIHLHAGLAYGRLLHARVDEGTTFRPEDNIDFSSLEPEFNKNQLSVLAGATFFLKQNFGITIRHYFSLNQLYSASSSNNSLIMDLNSYHFTIQALYMLK